MIEFNNPLNKNRIAIIVVGYNRIKEIKRLLVSLESAYYPIDESVPIIISIDASGNETLYEMVRSFEWSHGEKHVEIHNEKKGLKEHIFWCGNLSRFFKGVAIFEDDLYVSPYFYDYIVAALNAYKEETDVAGISLYNSPLNSLYQLPFNSINNGGSVYAYQDVATWGEVFNERMWYGFRNWLAKWKEDFTSVNMPPMIKTWTRAWSKYLYAYLIENKKYFIFPYISLCANFNDSPGEHGDGGNKWTSFALLMGRATFTFMPFSNLVKYDVYCHNIAIYDCLDLDPSILNIDFYGTKVYERYPKPFLLSTSILPYKIIKSFALTMRPIEMNVLLSMEGNGIFLYDTTEVRNIKSHIFTYEYLSYQLQGVSPKIITQYANKFVLRYLRKKLFKK